jgi:hypothetical protein
MARTSYGFFLICGSLVEGFFAKHTGEWMGCNIQGVKILILGEDIL